MAVHAVDEFEVDVVDALAVFKTVDQVQRRAANALDRRQAQLHDAGRNVHRLRAHFQRAAIGFVRVFHTKRHAAGTRAMLGGKVGRIALGFAVDDEVDVALAVQIDVLERCLATNVKPSCFISGSSTPGLGEANSTNSNPINPIGLSNKSAMAVLPAKWFLKP